MGKKITIAALAFRKGAEKFQDSFPEINRQGKDGAKLNDDRVHLPIGVGEDAVAEQRFEDAQVCG